MMDGFIKLSWMNVALIAFFATHVTMIGVTLFLHRSQAHKAAVLHPVLCHFFRLWLWLTTGMRTRDWVAVHRLHHLHVETEQDPHSPVVYGIWRVLFSGVGLYRKATSDKATIDRYGEGTPNDWLERQVYSKRNVGVLLMLLIDLLMFGDVGLLIWGVQMIWIPLSAAGIINGIGHYFGYRNFEPADQSRNILPWGIFILGEELHNNHHGYPRSARFSSRWFEFDLGYVYLRLFEMCGLAKILYVRPSMSDVTTLSGLKPILNARMSIFREFDCQVLKESFSKSVQLRLKNIFYLRKIKKLVTRNPYLLGDDEKKTLHFVLSLDESLDRVYQFRTQLYEIFYQKQSHAQDMLTATEMWCHEARATNQEALVGFANWVEQRFLGESSA